MDWLKQLITQTKATIGATTDAGTKAALESQLAVMEQQLATGSPAPAPTPPPSDPALSALQAQVLQMQATQQTLMDALTSEAAARTAAQASIEAQQTRDRATQITTLLETGKKDGRILPAKEADWKARLERDFDTISAVLADLPVNPAMAKPAVAGSDPKPTQTTFNATELRQGANAAISAIIGDA